MKQYITITGITEEATTSEQADVTIGKTYEVIVGCFDPFFVDDAGEQNFGCDEDDSVYLFTLHSGDE